MIALGHAGSGRGRPAGEPSCFGDRRGVRALVALLLLAMSGCRGCLGAAERPTASPEVVKEEAKKALERSPGVLSTICGVDVSALKDMVLTVVSSEGAKHRVRVEGSAVRRSTGAGSEAPPSADEDLDGSASDDAPSDDAGDDDDDAATPTIVDAPLGGDASMTNRAPIVTDPLKAIACAGIVALTIASKVDDHGGTEWRSSGLEVESVATAGVVFVKAAAKPSTPSRPRSRHHRHHHHCCLLYTSRCV